MIERSSSIRSQITPMLLTFNEEPNLPRTLASLDWASQILVVDSFSTDRTCEIVEQRTGAVLIQNRFESFARQCNFGLQHVQTPWTLSMDADYAVSAELLKELGTLSPRADTAGYRIPFKYCIAGRPLRASLYPPRVCLYRTKTAHYRDEGHGHRVDLPGGIETLNSFMLHDDRKPLERWLREQNRYMDIEAREILSAPWRQLNAADKVRRSVVFAPFLVFLHCLVVKGLVFDGWPGWAYTMQRTVAEGILSFKLAERLSARGSQDNRS